MNQPATVHIPVLLEPILRFVRDTEPTYIFDGTLGGGGHAIEMAKCLAPNGRLIACDRDAAAIEAFRHRLQNCDDLPALSEEQVVYLQGSYHELPEFLEVLPTERGAILDQVDFILLDLGLSSDQLADQQRGFSFKASGDLDLRFDRTQDQPAWELLQKLDEKEIADILWRYGEERFSRRIARQIVQRREEHELRKVADFRELIRRCIPKSIQSRIDPATRSFQALRIYVNNELGILEQALERLPQCLSIGGMIAIISFHSLEDRLVKNAFRDSIDLKVLSRKPIVADEREQQANPRARSAKLRVAQRVEVTDEQRTAGALGAAAFQRHSHCRG